MAQKSYTSEQFLHVTNGSNHFKPEGGINKKEDIFRKIDYSNYLLISIFLENIYSDPETPTLIRWKSQSIALY